MASGRVGGRDQRAGTEAEGLRELSGSWWVPACGRCTECRGGLAEHCHTGAGAARHVSLGGAGVVVANAGAGQRDRQHRRRSR